MCIVKDVVGFIKHGTTTFRNASKGQYNQSSNEVNEIRNEILSKELNRSDDKNNLLKDKKKIEKDVRLSFNKKLISLSPQTKYIISR